MAVAFLQIFLDFHPSRKFMMYVPINGISWKITLNKRTCIWSVLHLSEGTLLLGIFPLTFLFATYSRDSKLNIFTIVYSSSDHPTFLAKAQYIIWTLIPTMSNSSVKKGPPPRPPSFHLPTLKHNIADDHLILSLTKMLFKKK